MRYFLFLLIVIPQFPKAQSCSGHWVNNHPLTFDCISGEQIGFNNSSDPSGCPISPAYTPTQTNTFIFDNSIDNFILDFNAFSSPPNCSRIQLKINDIFYPLTSTNLVEIPVGANCTGFTGNLIVSPEGYITGGANSANNINGQGRILLNGVNATSVTISTNDGGGGSVFTSPCTPIVVPIKLKYFTGVMTENCKVILYWETGIELNVKNIQILSSGNGSEFKKIAEALPKGSDSRYSFETISNTGNYFKLKINDLDGRFSYSEIIRINNNCASSSIRISPNPSSQKISVENVQRDDQLIIVDILGRELYHVQVMNNSTEINIQQLPSGLYFLKVFRQHVKIETAKFVKK